ncbi:minichromosome maintenance protein MCM [Thermococcus sp.]|uniref:minichromosome maintenance protein MCM n=1 Tax=Thermococcus sp. TaxID=35749 RepID=UPI002601E22C|nr:minichromosome maintenance protein MCM [Thermococcus sp.]
MSEINVQFALGIIHMLKEKGKTEVEVKTLPNSLINVAKALGYDEDDTVPIAELEEYIHKVGGTNVPTNKDLDMDTKNIQVSKSIQNPLDTFSSEISKYPTGGTSKNSDENAGKENISLLLKAIREIIDTIDRPYKVVPFYVLLTHDELSAQELKELTLQWSEKLLGQQLSHNSLKMAMVAVNNSSMVYKRKDAITGVRYYRLMEKTKELIWDKYLVLAKEQEVLQKEEELKKADEEELIKAFVDFFSSYVDDEGRYVFIDQLRDLLTLDESRGLRVDWNVLNAINPTLAERLLSEPEAVISAAEDAVKIVLREQLFEENSPEIHVRFVNLPGTLSPRRLRSEHIGRLVQVRGVVSAIAEGEKSNGVKGFIEKAVFVCKDCGNEMTRLQRPYENFIVPQKCDACGSRNIELDIEKSTIVDMREIFVQDPSDALHAAGTASYVRVILLDDNARMDVNPGDEVLITGIVRGVMRKKNGKPALGWVLEANSLTKLTKDVEDLEITPEDVRKFREMVQDKEFDSKLIRSLAPAITGREVEKKAVLLALFSGEDYDIAGTHVRKRSHVLLFGDAGTGKSEIIRHAAQIAPGGVHSTGTHSSGVGLTAAIDTMDGVRVLRAGVLVLADRGVAALDELDKMREEDYDKMLDALEQGWFPYNKAGFNTRLMARAVVVAAANPPGGEFDRHNYRPFDELKRLFDQPFYSRFDLIIPVFKDEDEATLERIADAVLDKHVGEIEPPYDSETLTKFIAYARREIPRVSLPPALRETMKEYMVALAKTMGSAAPRAMEAIIRLTEAHARMHLREKATLADFLAAKELFDEMITRLAGSSDEEEKEEVMKGLAGVIWTEEKKRMVDKLWSILKYYEGLDERGEGVHINDIIEEARQYGIERSEVLLLLEDMERVNMVEQSKSGFYRLRRR